MEPFEQGDLDGLCGIYSVINATRLLYGRQLTEEECGGLLTGCIALLERRKRISRVIDDGISTNNIAYLIKKVIASSYPVIHERPFHNYPNISLDVFWEQSRSFLTDHQQRAIIILFQDKAWRHWSVVRSATAKRLTLFDSDGCCWINRQSSTIKKLSYGKSIKIFPSHTYFLTRQ